MRVECLQPDRGRSRRLAMLGGICVATLLLGASSALVWDRWAPNRTATEPQLMNLLDSCDEVTGEQASAQLARLVRDGVAAMKERAKKPDRVGDYTRQHLLRLKQLLEDIK